MKNKDTLLEMVEELNIVYDSEHYMTSYSVTDKIDKIKEFINNNF